METCLLKRTLSLIFITVPILCVPINIGQDPDTIGTFGYVAATDYEEWKRCKGYNCRIWYGEKYYVQRIKCVFGDKSACTGQYTEKEQTVEEDVFLTPEQVIMMSKNLHLKTRKKRTSSYRVKRKVNQYTSMSKQWELPIIYLIDDELEEIYHPEIRKAIEHWEKQTCIRFKAVPPNTAVPGPHIVFIKGNICASYIGQIPVYPQPIQLNSDCTKLGSIAHEIGHLVGFWHEHQRTDRDNYVIIHGENARTTSERMYSLELKGTTANLVPYDYGSLMHYRAWAFAKSGQQTIEPVDKMYIQTLGQKVGMSFLDAKLANIAYCNATCPTPLPASCLHNGYQDPNACHRCRCPDGLGGIHCETVAPSKYGDCSEVIELHKGESRKIYSPGYQTKQPYEDNVECNWIVRAPSNHRVLVIFDGFIFGVFCETGVPVCFHWVEIKYHKDFSRTGPRLCCHGYPDLTIRSEGSELVITLRANFETSPLKRRGFMVIVTSEKDCGQAGGRVLPSEINECPKNLTDHEPIKVEEDITEQDEIPSQKNMPKTPSLTNSQLINKTLTVQKPNTKTDNASLNKGNTTDSELNCVFNNDHQNNNKIPATIKLCSKMDLVILFDVTWSPSVTFALVIKFLQDFISLLTVGPDNVQVAFVTFGEEATITFSLKQLDTKQQVLEAMTRLTPIRGKTNAVAAFNRLQEILADPNGGHRSNVNTVCFLFINSGSSIDSHLTIPSAEKARENNVYIFAVGTSWANQNEINGIVGGDTTRSIFRSTMKLMLSDNIAVVLYKAMCDIMVKADNSQTLSYHNTEPVSWTCNFETSTGNPTYCDMYQDHGLQKLDWRIWKGRTFTSLTGPNVAQSGSYYIYIESSLKTSHNYAEIYLPSQNWGGPLCLSFYANMFGKHIGQLKVVVRYNKSFYKTLWEQSGDNGITWFHIQLNLTLSKCERVGFIASTTAGTKGDIAIDTINITNGICDMAT